MWTGIGLDYSLGDFSRLQDPRSRTQEIVYTIKPGVAFRFGKEKIGLNLSYGYSKEKIGSYVSKSKDSKEYLLYLQEGLGVYSILVSNYYELGKQTATMAVDILKNGKKPAEMPVQYLSTCDFTYNPDTVKILGIELPSDLLK